MKVLHVVNSAETGGAQTLIEAIGARADPRDEHHVFVLMGPDALSSRLESAAASVHYGNLAKSAKNPLPALATLHRLVRNLDIDVVHSHLMQSDLVSALTPLHFTVPLPGRRAGERKAVARVSTLHTSGGHESSRAARVVGRVVALLSRRFDAVVACSPSARNYAATMGYHRHSRIPVILNGTAIDHAAQGTSPASTRTPDLAEAVEQNQEGPVIVSLSRWHPMKDHETLIRSFAEFCEEYPQAILECAGGEVTASNPDLVALVERAGVSARVRLHGPVKDVSVLLARADAMVISSSHGEALPMAGIEALSAGVPVVTTDVGDCHLLAIEDSLLVPARSPHRIAAALGEVLRGGKEYSRAAKKLASDRFDIDDTVQRYRGVYQRVLAFRRRSTR